MIFRNLFSVLTNLPILAISLIANAERPQFTDTWLKEISLGFEKGHISPILAKRLLEVRLDEISKSGKLVLTDFEVNKAQLMVDQLDDQSQTMMGDDTLTGK